MLLFVSETWVLPAAMMQKINVINVGFLQQVIGKKAIRLGDKNWRKEGAESVLQAAGKKTLNDYIIKSQATVAEWVSLRSIFEVCAKETGYEGEGRFQYPCAAL